MTLQQVCSLYLEGMVLRQQARQLSQKMLAGKFERSERTICKIANRMPCSVPEDEQDLIRDCISERDRLKSKASELSMPRLCFKYRFCHSTVESELIRTGVWEAA